MIFFPPLALIEDKLFGSPDGASENDRHASDDPPASPDNHPSDPLPAPQQELPAALAQMIHRDSTRACLEDAPPAIRDIRLVRSVINGHGESVRDLAAPVAVLLDHANEDGSWRAWLVSSETGYASDHDLLIDHHDGPTDSRAGMVQLWNRINVRLEQEALLLGRMTLERMALIRRLAAGSPDLRAAAVNIRPGKVGAVTLADGQTMVTGGPVVLAEDKRHDLRDLYRRFAIELNTHAVASRRAASDPVLRNGPLPPPALLEISLAEDALLPAVLDLMCDIGAAILPRRTPANTLCVSVSEAEAEEAVRRLRLSPLVRAATATGSSPDGRRR